MPLVHILCLVPTVHELVHWYSCTHDWTGWRLDCTYKLWVHMQHAPAKSPFAICPSPFPLVDSSRLSEIYDGTYLQDRDIENKCSVIHWLWRVNSCRRWTIFWWRCFWTAPTQSLGNGEMNHLYGRGGCGLAVMPLRLRGVGNRFPASRRV